MRSDHRDEGIARCDRPLRVLVVILLGVVGLLCTSRTGMAQIKRPVRIGALTASWGPTPPIVGLRDGLVELGYREDEDFFIGVRFTRGDESALPAAARELIAYGIDILFVDFDDAARVAKMTATQVPVVFAAAGDPLGLGLVRSFARPGGNITGVAHLTAELSPKRLEMFQQLVLGLKHVLFLYHESDIYARAEAVAFREAARRLGIALTERVVRTAEEARKVLDQLQANHIDGMLQPPSLALDLPGLVLKAATAQNIPTMFRSTFWVENGALASYGQDFHESGRQAARLVDKIIKGAKPAELPVEVNSSIEFAINLKTAKALGLTIVPEVLYRADKIVR